MNSSIRIFDEKLIEEIGKISGLASEKLMLLAARLEAIGKDFRTIVLTTPTDLPLGPADARPSDRQKWLRDRLLRPLDQLLNSIDHREMMATWPDPLPSELSDGDWSHLATLLGKLRQFSEELSESLQSRTADRSSVNAEFHCELVWRLADACREAGLPLSRHRIGKIGYKRSGPRVIELACKAICGRTFPIDTHLRDYLKLHQE